MAAAITLKSIPAQLPAPLATATPPPSAPPPAPPVSSPNAQLLQENKSLRERVQTLIAENAQLHNSLDEFDAHLTAALAYNNALSAEIARLEEQLSAAQRGRVQVTINYRPGS